MKLLSLLRLGRDDRVTGGSSHRSRGLGASSLATGAMAAYAVAFVVLSPSIGSQLGILATLPVMLGGWLLGLRGGLVFGGSAVVINVLLVFAILDIGLQEWVQSGGLLGSGALLLVGGITGWLRDLRTLATREVAERKKAEETLHDLLNALDEQIKKRTAELSDANLLLRQEIAEREKSDEQLIRARERERLHVEQTPLGVIEWNLDFEVAAWNAAAARIFGYGASEAMSSHASFIVPESFKAQVDTVWKELLQQRGGARSTNENVRKDGETIQCEWFNTPLIDPEGNVIAVASLVQDVTAEKQTQLAFEETNQRLEETLVELQSTQEQMVRQERLRALGTMASGIAHDINNAVSPVVSYVDLLLMFPETLDDKEQTNKYLREISTAANDITEVVGRLREFYRHRDDAELMVRVDLNQVISDAISLTRPRWRDMALGQGIDISVTTDLAGDLPPVEGDEAGLRTAFTNLILNAADAMPEGGVLRLRTSHSDGQTAVEVSDTGTGMSEEARSRAFEPFFTTKGVNGTGLGLAMVYGTVQRHKGTVEIESAEGRGTTVTIRLPLGQPKERLDRDAEPMKEAPKGLRILIADDDAAIRRILIEYLSRDGHAVEETTSGQEAIERFDAGSFEIIITDRAMPQMGGDELASSVKQASPSTPVIMLTGFGNMMETSKERPPGVDFILSKPFTLSGLRRALSYVSTQE